MKKIFFIFSILITCNLICAQDTDSIKFISLNPEKFREEMTMVNNPVLIDVREFFEYRKSRIRHAINIPSSGNLEYAADTLNKNHSYFLYCTSGFRSKRVAKYFTEHGFSKVFSMDGGIADWRKEGYPVDRKKVRRNP